MAFFRPKEKLLALPQEHRANDHLQELQIIFSWKIRSRWEVFKSFIPFTKPFWARWALSREIERLKKIPVEETEFSDPDTLPQRPRILKTELPPAGKVTELPPLLLAPNQDIKSGNQWIYDELPKKVNQARALFNEGKILEAWRTFMDLNEWFIYMKETQYPSYKKQGFPDPHLEKFLENPPWKMEEDPYFKACDEVIRATYPAKKELTLSWEDLIFMNENSIGLRHEHRKKEALKEMKEGGEGDAVTLGHFGFFDLDKRRNSKTVELLEAHKEVLNHVDLTRLKYSPHVQDILLRRMEYYLWDFINDSCIRGYTSSNSTFFLMKMPGGDDYGRYPLGKAGKQRFEKDQILLAIERKKGDPWDADDIFKKVIAGIQKMRAQENKEAKPSPK